MPKAMAVSWLSGGAKICLNMSLAGCLLQLVSMHNG